MRLRKAALFGLALIVALALSACATPEASYGQGSTALMPKEQCKRRVFHPGGLYPGNGCEYPPGYYCVMYVEYSVYDYSPWWPWGGFGTYSVRGVSY